MSNFSDKFYDINSAKDVDLMNFEKAELKLLKTIETHELMKQEDKVLIGVSGGIDSMSLLFMLNRLKEYLKVKLLVAHLNHSLRADESDRDQAFVAEFCDKIGVEFFVKKIDVKSTAKCLKRNLEEVARYERYDFFAELSTKYKLDKIVTAHTASDQAETVLMRIIRGCGLDGLVSIKYKRTDCVIRPLLDVTRSEVKEYNRKFGFPYVKDSSNHDLKYLRNKIRHVLIPELETNYNGKIVQNLSKLASNVGSEVKFLTRYSNSVYDRLALKIDEKVSFHVPSFMLLGKPLRRRLIKRAVFEVNSYCEVELEASHINGIFELLRKNKNGSVLCLTKKIAVAIQREHLVVYDNSVEVENFEYCYHVNFNKEYKVESTGIILLFRIEPPSYQLLDNEMALNYENMRNSELTFRNCKKGDRISLYFDGSGKKICDFFTDMKISKRLRGSMPIFCVDDKPAAIIGVRVAENWKPSAFFEKVVIKHNVAF